MANYIRYTHLNSKILKIEDLFRSTDERDSVFINITPEEFLSKQFYTGQNTVVTNADLIFKMYSKKQQYYAKTPSNITSQDIILLNTTVFIPEENFRRDLVYEQTLNLVRTTSFPAFAASKLKNLINNRAYVQDFVFNDTLNKVVRKNEKIQVFAWCRSLKNNDFISDVDVWRSQGNTEDTIEVSDLDGNTKKSFQGEKNSLEGSWIDISPFVESLTTNVTDTGGNFSLVMSPVSCLFDPVEGWIFDGVDSHLNSDLNFNFSAKSPIHRIFNDKLKRNQYYFKNAIFENDLIFIKFEELELEKEDRDRSKQKTRLNSSDIPSITDEFGVVTQERIYDMIGLVDAVNVSSEFNGKNNVTINIRGRDLIKTLIEDNTVFFPTEFAQKMFLSAGEADRNNSRLLKRCLFTGSIQSLNIYYHKKLSSIVAFIISQLSNTGYVPDSVFYAYKSRRNTTLTLVNAQSSRRDDAEKSNFHIDKIAEYIQDSRNYYRIANRKNNRDENAGLKTTNPKAFVQAVLDFTSFLIATNIAYPSFDGEDYYLQGWKIWKSDSSFFNTFSKVMDIPTDSNLRFENQFPDSFYGYLFPEREFIYNDELGFDVYNNPIIYSSAYNAISHAYAYLKTKRDKNDGDKVESRLLQGVWQIIDVLIDNSVANRILVDTSISEEQGSLLNTMNRIAVKPFVEFFTDTYGDKFYFIFRKPPFDEKSIISMIYGDNLTTEESNELNYEVKFDSSNTDISNLSVDPTVKNQNLANIIALSQSPDELENAGIIIDIEEGDIVNENLEYYNGEIYSWYRIDPVGYLMGNGGEMIWQFLPAILFEEYSDIWGSKPLMVQHPYLPFKAQSGYSEAFQQDEVLVQSFYDLKYLIDCNAYLPFTRTGSITLAAGDRRIKRGMWIRYKGTGEVFYVDSVSNSYSAEYDRSTTLQVSRGMIEKFLKPQNIEGISKPVSYFNIINTELNFQKKNNQNDGKNFISNIENSNSGFSAEAIIYWEPYDLNAKFVLSNFSVNKEVFNFFLQKRQEDENV